MMRVMTGNRLPEFGPPHHGRVLVPAFHQGIGGLAPHILRAGIIGKALAEIDRPVSRARRDMVSKIVVGISAKIGFIARDDTASRRALQCLIGGQGCFRRAGNNEFEHFALIGVLHVTLTNVFAAF